MGLMSQTDEDVEFAHEHLSVVLTEAATYLKGRERLGVPTRCAGIEVLFNNVSERWELTVEEPARRRPVSRSPTAT